MCDDDHDSILRRHAGNVFSSVEPGELTVYTDKDVYRITAHLTAVPDFVRDGVRRWRWEAEFIADEPFWRRGEMMEEITLNEQKQGSTIIFSDSPVKVPVLLTISTATTIWNKRLKLGIFVGYPETSITIDTETFTVKDPEGNNANYLLYNNAEIGDFYLLPGENEIFNASGHPVVKWWKRAAVVL